MSEAQDLNDIANFVILITTGALIPFFLVIYKSRCSSICWGCIQRKVIGDSEDEDVSTQQPAQQPTQQPRSDPDNQNP